MGWCVTLKVYFDLSGEENWGRNKWEHSLSCLRGDPDRRIEIVNTLEDADISITTVGTQLNNSSFRSEFRGILSNERKVLVWDTLDFPTGQRSGLYCSLDRRIFDPARHATFSYPFTPNELVDYGDLSEARYDFIFYGGLTSGVRKRLVRKFERDWRGINAYCRIAETPWHIIFSRPDLDIKKEYAAALRHSRFVLCPRGNGAGTIRLFEVLRAGRVPIILSDRFVLPSHIDWSSCALRIPELKLDEIPEIVSRAMDRWPDMAKAARDVWEKNFSNESLLGYMGRLLPPLAESAGAMTMPAKLGHLSGLARVKLEIEAKKGAGRALGWVGR